MKFSRFLSMNLYNSFEIYFMFTLVNGLFFLFCNFGQRKKWKSLIFIFVEIRKKKLSKSDECYWLLMLQNNSKKRKMNRCWYFEYEEMCLIYIFSFKNKIHVLRSKNDFLCSLTIIFENEYNCIPGPGTGDIRKFRKF
jgi:hypothetical protein